MTAAIMNAQFRDDLNFLYTPDYCYVWNSVDQSVANVTDTPLAFNSETDLFGMHDPAANTKIVVQKTGQYLVGFTVQFAANATGSRRVYVRRNGSGAAIPAVTVPTAGTAADTAVSGVAMYTLNATEYLEVMAWQNSTAALNVRGSLNLETIEFWIRLVG